MKRIGILGYGGTVGKIAVSVLAKQEGIQLRLGQRTSLTTLPVSSKVEYYCVDIYQKNQLQQFCQDCDVILNCAGPSFLIQERIAIAAANANAHYVDAFGDKLLLDKFTEHQKIYNTAVVVSAGAFPGLSGLLINWFAEHYFDYIDVLALYTGGMEYCSSAAALDWLLSVLADFGVVGAYLSDKKWIRSDPLEANNYYSIAGFHGKVQIQRFISNELQRLSLPMIVKSIHGFNVITDNTVSELIARWCGQLSLQYNEDLLKEASNELIHATTLAVAGRNHWYTLMVEASGYYYGKLQQKRLLLTSKNSYELSGNIAALTVLKLLKSDYLPGGYYATDILDSGQVIHYLQQINVLDLFEVTDISMLTQDSLLVEPDEGII